MNLLQPDTTWIFMLPSTGELEPRHIYDVAYGVNILLKNGIEKNNIRILMDNYNQVVGKYIFLDMGIVSDFDILPVSSYYDVVADIKSSNIVIFVTGHGSINGFDCIPPIKPNPFYEALKKLSSLENAIVILGQCEAGVYNYVSLKNDKDKSCNIVAIGAAGLENSISTSQIIYKGKWEANVFLVYFFSWINKPIDIDGDDHFSVIDAYKYASYMTLQTCKNIENSHNIELERRAVELHQRREQLVKLKTEKGLTLDEELELKSIDKVQIMIRLDQRPWILNAIPASKIYFNPSCC